MKILNLVLAIMFVVFAFLQVNDPDPLLWIGIYGAMAILCVLAAFRMFYKWVILALLVAFVGYAIYLFPGVQEWLAQDDKSVLFDDLAKMQYPFVEDSREFLGLVICMVVLIMHLFQAGRSRPA